MARQGDDEMTKSDRIADLPSTREVSDFLPVVRVVRRVANLIARVGLGGAKAKRIVESADELLAHADILDLPDRFNAAFGERGWVATSSLSVEVMRTALESQEGGDIDAAEAIILDWVLMPDTINLFAITRSKSFNVAQDRWHQLREALALTQEERYWSAIPLILLASDGFASDVLGTSPFEKNADLSLFDSMVAHPTALPALITRLTKGVRKSSDAPLSLPLRHGILHGRSLGYANRAVCGKAWMLMIALVDWAADKRDEEAPRARNEARNSTDWRAIAASIQKNEADKRAIEAFTQKEWDGPFDAQLSESEPPLAFREFLAGWQARNFGLMAKRAVNLTQQTQGHLAGRMRSDAEFVQLTAFEILSVKQTTVARAEARVFMRGRTLKDEVEGEFAILAFRHTPGGTIAMPNDEGTWHVQQGCVFDLMHQRTVEKDSE